MMKQFEQSELLKSLPKQFFASLVGKVGKVMAQGHDVINLGQGNPDQPTPSHIVETLQKASANPMHHKYSPFRGHKFLKDAVATFYKREYGVDVDPEKEVAILFGGKGGLVEIPQCLLNPGDTVLVPDPGYPDYWSGVELAKAKMEVMPLTAENHFLPVYEEVSERAKEQAKLMFLNYPNNPTGAVATAEFLKTPWRLLPSTIFVWYTTLPTEQLDLMVKSQSAFYRLLVQKRRELKFILFLKRITWRDGELDLL